MYWFETSLTLVLAIGVMMYVDPRLTWLALLPAPLVSFAVIFFGRRMWRRNHYWAATQGAESVLRERYARGEIDETEYRQRLEVLRAHPTK